VEERLVRRQEKKLQMEEQVLYVDADNEGSTGRPEILSAAEVLELIQHGERALQSFPGEQLEGCSLRQFFERGRQPLPKEFAESAEPSELEGLDPNLEGERFVQDLEEENANMSLPESFNETHSSLPVAVKRTWRSSKRHSCL